MSIGKIMKRLREAKGWSQAELSRRADISRPRIVQLESNPASEVKSETLSKLAKALGCTRDELSGARPSEPLVSFVSEPGSPYHVSDLVDVPMYDAELAAGDGTWAPSDHAVGSMPFPRAWLVQNGLPTSGLVVAYAKGDSMSPTIRDGSTLLIDTNQRRPMADHVFAFSNGDSEIRVKRLAKRIDGMWVIRSDNTDPAYRDEPISPQDIPRLHIIGRVVFVMGGI